MPPAVSWESIERRLEALRPVELAAELVRIPSHPGVPRQEEAAALRLRDWLAAHGVAASLRDVAPGRPNLLATVGAAAAVAGRRLLFCGHTDTVPWNAGAMEDGFAGEVRGGRLTGRGAVDMKGPLAAMAAALAAVADAIGKAGGSLTLAAVVDEEMESLGAEALVAGGGDYDGAVVGEPTGLRVALGHRGLEWLRVRFEGRAAHGGTPERGVNAILAAARFMTGVERRLQPEFRRRTHPLLGPPTLNFGTIRGGDQPSTVAAACELTLDRRSVPGETFDSMAAELRQVLREVEAEMPGLTTRLERVEGGMATLEHRALITDPSIPVARAALAARRALGLGPPDGGEAPIAFPAWTDGALLAAFGGWPTIVLGPGDLGDAHSPRESIAVEEIETASRLYARLAWEFCGLGSAS